MLGGLARVGSAGQGRAVSARAAAGRQRKSMQPMAERLGVDHQQLQQFMTSSTWDYGEVRRRLARWAEEVDRPGRVGDRRHRVPEGRHRLAGGGPAVLGHAGQGRQLPDRGQRARGHRLRLGGDRLAAVLPAPGTTPRPTIPQAAEQIRHRRARSKIPNEVRHREKWRLALDMLDEITGEITGERSARVAGAWTAAGGRRRRLRRQHRVPARARPNAACPTWWQVKPDDHRPPRRRGTGHPALHRPGPATPARATPTRRPPGTRSPWPRAGRSLRRVTWRHGTRTQPRQPDRGDALPLPGPAGPPRQPRHPPRRRRHPARVLADRRMATRQARTHRLLAVQPARRHPTARPGPASRRSAGASNTTTANSKTASASTTSKAAPTSAGTATSPSPPLAQAFCTLLRLRPKSRCAGLTLYAVLRELQHLLAIWTGACHTCKRPYPAPT